MKRIIAALGLLAALTAAQSEPCKPTKIIDGDTFHTVDKKIRLAGYDAPERGQPYSKRAKQKLDDLVAWGADCECYKRDRYGRDVCRVTVYGRSVAELMLLEGFGCIDPRFENEDTPAQRDRNRAALDKAKQIGAGMWAQPNPECGKEYRDRKKAGQS